MVVNGTVIHLSCVSLVCYAACLQLYSVICSLPVACTVTSLIPLWCLCVLLQRGWTALHWACRCGHPLYVEVLVDYQADLRIVTGVCLP